MKPIAERLAVCSWSLQARDIGELIERVRATGLTRVQLAIDPLIESPGAWGGGPAGALAKLRGAGLGVASGMFGGVGEDYSTLETIKATGGVVPDATWPALRDRLPAIAHAARAMGLGLVTFHAGFLPHEADDPSYAKLAQRIAYVAGVFVGSGVRLGFETGQETAQTLAEFLEGLALPGVGVNFDPANMILYGKGDPVQAVRRLGPWLVQCHIKDAIHAVKPGQWGAEVSAGTGQVDFPAFFEALRELGYAGDLCIEREAGDQRVRDIASARELVERLA
jgi:sugar phosphate isomerase/epimerase